MGVGSRSVRINVRVGEGVGDVGERGAMVRLRGSRSSRFRRNSCAASARWLQSGADLLQHAVQQKCQRFQQHDGMFKIDAFGKNQLRFEHSQVARHCAPRQLLQTGSLLSQALAERNFG